MFILLALLLLLSSLLIYWFFSYCQYERFLKKFPGPVPIPLLGSTVVLCSAKDRIKRLLECRDKYNGDFKVYVGFEPLLFLSEPESLEAILSSTVNLQKAKLYKFLKNWIGNGILVSNGEYWRKHRKIITKAFHFQILEKYVAAFRAVNNVLVEQLKDQVGKGAFDIFPYIHLCALDIMCESTMGVSVNAQINSDSEYVKNVKKMGLIVTDRTFSPLLQHDFFYRFSSTCWTEKRALKVLHGQSHSIIERKILENKKVNSNEMISSKPKLAFLDLLLHHNADDGSLSVDEIREEVDTLLFEGHDTTASAVSFVLYCLANHSEVQDRVYQEISSILPDGTSESPSYQNLNDMKYLDAAIKESMRLYPPVPAYGRQLVKDVKYGDKVLPKGLAVLVFAIGAHRNPKVFPNPLVFDPDRFLPENCLSRNPYAYAAFSAGPRNCIGQKFAMLEMKFTISTLLRHFRLLPSPADHKMELLLETVMTSANGIVISIEKR